MLKLNNYDGKIILISPAAIAQVTEAGTSSQWHGIRSIVHTFDKRVLEVQQSYNEIQSMLAKEYEV